MLDFYLKGTDSKVLTHQQYSARSLAGIFKSIEPADLVMIGESIVLRARNQIIRMLRHKNMNLKLLGLKIA
jgi:hypothetical protein